MFLRPNPRLLFGRDRKVTLCLSPSKESSLFFCCSVMSLTLQAFTLTKRLNTLLIWSCVAQFLFSVVRVLTHVPWCPSCLQFIFYIYNGPFFCMIWYLQIWTKQILNSLVDVDLNQRDWRLRSNRLASCSRQWTPSTGPSHLQLVTSNFLQLSMKTLSMNICLSFVF